MDDKLNHLFGQLKVQKSPAGIGVSFGNFDEQTQPGKSTNSQSAPTSTPNKMALKPEVKLSNLTLNGINKVSVSAPTMPMKDGTLDPHIEGGPSSEDGKIENLLKSYQAKREASNAQKQMELEEQMKALSVPKTFNRKKVSRALLEQMRSLPIYSAKDTIIQAVKNNQVVIVMGETGSGKSTQIPQYLVEAGFAKNGKIGITQPRRVAARSLAERVAIECGVKLGTLVGYAVRFEKRVSGDTVIKFLTDGLLVKEFSQEPNMDAYSVIIIDEAHERSIHTDVCFGLLKRAAEARPDLKIIISSATLEEKKFSAYFNAPVIKVSGKGYDVQLVYEPRTEYDYIQGAIDTIFKIHSKEPIGDVLVFLTGQDEIDQVWDHLENGILTRKTPSSEIIILPCYGALPFEEQQRIFEETPAGSRKVILSTNIAETSLTIDGIVYVVDCGFYKQNEYNPKTGISSLVRHRISKFQAIQRAGRAGRTRAGKCYRLYSQYQFSLFKEAPEPEIKRCNVNSVVLDLISMGVSDPMVFEFLDQPPTVAIMETLEHLQELGALDVRLGLTVLGRRMSKFPLDPPLAKVLIVSTELQCSSEALKIVALLSTQFQNIFYRSKKMRNLADAKKAIFNQPEGDHLSLLKVYECWKMNLRNDAGEAWCKQNFINHRHLAEAEEIRVQLRDILFSHGLSEITCGRMKENLQKAFTAGYFRQIAKKQVLGHGYTVLNINNHSVMQSEAFIHPSSSLFHLKPNPPWLLYHEIVKTSKPYIRGAIIIEPEWIKKYAPEFAKKLTAAHGNSVLM